MSALAPWLAARARISPERPAIACGEITLDLDVRSLAGAPIVLSEVRLLAPAVHIEVDDAGRSNIGALIERLSDGTAGVAGCGCQDHCTIVCRVQ